MSVINSSSNLAIIVLAFVSGFIIAKQLPISNLLSSSKTHVAGTKLVGKANEDISPTTEKAAAAAAAASSSSDSDQGGFSDPEQDYLMISAVKPRLSMPCKLVLVMRTDLGMSKGKMIAQAAHATLACYKTLEKSNPAILKQWAREGQAKIALQVAGEDELLLLQARAQSLNLAACVIQDAGRTQIEAGSRTCLGVGPGPVDLINEITGHLKLL